MDAEKLIPWVLTGIATVIAFAGWLRGNKTDTKDDARWQGGIDEQLKQINKKLDPITTLPGRFDTMEYQVKELKDKLDKHLCEHKGE